MKAIVNSISPGRYLPLKILGRVWPGVYYSGAAALKYKTDWPEPKLPSAEWAKVRPTLAGICGSDVALIELANPPDSFAKAFISSPFVMGHESVGRITEVGEQVEGFRVGDRVNVEPGLGCAARGIQPACPMCREGLLASCHNLAAGRLPPGMAIGFNSATSGAWSEAFVGHRSQLFKVPEALTDEQALLVDPLACALHAVLRRKPRDEERVLILGSGIIGLALVNAIRAVGSKARIIMLGRHEFQRDLALARGADTVALPGDFSLTGMYGYFAKQFQCRMFRGFVGKPILLGGADVVYDAVGSRDTTEDALRLARSGGTVVIIGMGHARWVDWDPVTWKHLTIMGVNGRAFEAADPARRHTYQIVHEMLLDGRLKTDGLLTHTIPLADYRSAFQVLANKGRTGCVKAALRI